MPLITGLLSLITGIITFVGLVVLAIIIESLCKRWYGPDVYARERQIALARDNYTCQVQLPGCLIYANITHHITPRRCGGPDTADNLMTVCTHCHPLVEPRCCDPII